MDRYERIPFEGELPVRVNHGSRLSADQAEVAFSWHEQLELLRFRQGGAVVHCGEKRLYAKDGDMILINPFELHRVVYGDGEPLYECVMIDPSLCRELPERDYFDLLRGGRFRFENRLQRDAALIRSVDELCREMREKAFAYEWKARACALSIVVTLLRGHAARDISLPFDRSLGRYARIRPALDYMQLHLSEPVTLEEMARACSVSPAHFCRLFKQITGDTPVTFLTRMRLYEAASLLRRQEGSLADVAARTGFADAAYLSRKFKRQFGLTPARIRRMAREGALPEV